MDNRLTTHNENILVIEDDSEVFAWVEAQLSDAGYRVGNITGPESVFEGIREVRPDLVILDLALAHANSLELLSQINHQYPDLPVIVIFEQGLQHLTVDVLRLKVMDYMIRPLRVERLLFSVHSSLLRGRLEQENQKYREQLEQANAQLQARLEEMQADQQAGRLVQRKMLPRTPCQIFNYQFEHLIFPASYLAGDFVDYHQVSDDKLVFFMVDVTGHNAASAFVTVLVKQMAMRSRRHFMKDQVHNVKSAAWMLSWMNRSLLEADVGCHLTIFMGVIDATHKTLNYSYGGQFPQAIFSSPDTCCYLKGRGLPVGLFEDASYEDHTIELPEKFSINLFSDGILEIMLEASLADKEARLLQIVKEGKGRLNSIYEQLGLESIENAPDDISLLTIHTL